MFEEKFSYKSYKFALICAFTLHFVLFVFVFVKFRLSDSYSTGISSSDIVQASVIDQRVVSKQVRRVNNAKQEIVKKEEKIKKIVKEEINETSKVDPDAIKLKKQKMLKEKEMKNIENEIARENKEFVEKKQAIDTQKDIENALAEEKDELDIHESELKEELSGLAGAKGVGKASGSGKVDKYKAAILQAISSNWIVPDGVDKNATCLLVVDVGPNGVVLDVKVVKSSGNLVLDNSAQKAVLKSSPLPVPNEPSLFDDFRTIKLTVRPEGVF